VAVLIREEQPTDMRSIREVNIRAFEQEQEANIVDALRANGAVVLSLVATVDGYVVGHIMFSPISVGEMTGVALAPMAVLPECQRQGVGSQLIATGMQRLKDAGCPFVIVLGHAGYYPRFGFVPASTRAIQCEWDVADNVFMVFVLDETRMQGVSGTAKYREEFSTVT
jgi:putative acetyltransferase